MHVCCQNARTGVVQGCMCACLGWPMTRRERASMCGCDVAGPLWPKTCASFVDATLLGMCGPRHVHPVWMRHCWACVACILCGCDVTWHVWPKTCASCVDATLLSLCGPGHACGPLWSKTCASCVDATLIGLCGPRYVHPVWMRRCWACVAQDMHVRMSVIKTLWVQTCMHGFAL